MQTDVSFLQNRKKEDSNDLVHRRLRTVAQRQVDSGDLEQPPGEGRQAQSPARDSGSRSFNAKLKPAIRFFYKWLTRLLLIGMLILLAVLIMFLWAPKTSGPAAKDPTPVARSMTARNAYDVSRSVARQWAADSQLIGLSATWDADQIFNGGEGDWSLTYYSPSNSKTALISVIDGRATLISARGYTGSPIDPQIELWEIDSPAVVDQLREHGGNEFLRSHPEVSLTMSLNLQEDAGWKARLIHQESRRELSVKVDIQSGVIIDLAQSE